MRGGILGGHLGHLRKDPGCALRIAVGENLFAHRDELRDFLLRLADRAAEWELGDELVERRF